MTERGDIHSFGCNDECIRVTLSRPGRGKVKLGTEGIIVIDKIVITDEGDVELVEELRYQVRFRYVESITLLPNVVGVVLNVRELWCAVKA
jgi:hypothetical protein